MSDTLSSALAAALGPGGLLFGDDAAPFATDWRGLVQGRTPAVLRPRDTASVAAAIRLLAEAGAPVVPQGGNTGLVAGATPDASGTQFVLSLGRMDRVRALDRDGPTLTVEAGATLARAQAAAAEAGFVLPLSIASEGSATVGGVLAANAGGSMTIRHGNARDLVLGLEVVLPDGTVWDGLRALRKDNTGYALRHLFVGSEGTLGVITAAVLQLAPRPRVRVTALCAVADDAAALRLLGRFRDAEPGALLAFEYMSADGVALVERHMADVRLPLATRGPAYVLLELVGGRDDGALRALAEEVLAAALDAGEVLDATLAESETQRRALWRLREEHTDAQARAGLSVKNDVSVPVNRLPAFLADAAAAARAVLADVVVAPFGHLGDGNIHFNLVQGPDAEAAPFRARAEALAAAVNAAVRAHGGSFSAEHGVGALKAGMMTDWRGGAELALMRRIKRAIDPAGIMNPGKLLPPEG